MRKQFLFNPGTRLISAVLSVLEKGWLTPLLLPGITRFHLSLSVALSASPFLGLRCSADRKNLTKFSRKLSHASVRYYLTTGRGMKMRFAGEFRGFRSSGISVSGHTNDSAGIPKERKAMLQTPARSQSDDR